MEEEVSVRSWTSGEVERSFRGRWARACERWLIILPEGRRRESSIRTIPSPRVLSSEFRALDELVGARGSSLAPSDGETLRFEELDEMSSEPVSEGVRI